MKLEDVRRIRVRILFWFLWNITRGLPFSLASDLLSLIGRTFASKLTQQDVIRGNLAKAFPEKSPEWVKLTALAIASNFGRFAAELCHVDYLRDNGTFTVSGKEQVELARDKPLIFVGAHLGSWEMIPLFLNKNGIHLTIIYTKFGTNYMDGKLLMVRGLTGADYIEKELAVRSAMRAMKKGRSVALLVDQRVSTGVEVEFFGRKSIVTKLPARLALRFKAHIIPVGIERKAKDHFHISFGRAIAPAIYDGAGAEGAITQRMMNSLEAMIRGSPETWFCNTRRW